MILVQGLSTFLEGWKFLVDVCRSGDRLGRRDRVQGSGVIL